MYQYKVLKKYEAVVTESIALESPRELTTDEVEDLAIRLYGVKCLSSIMKALALILVLK